MEPKRKRGGLVELYRNCLIRIVLPAVWCWPGVCFAQQEESQHNAEWQELQAETDPESFRENDEQWTLLQRYLRRPLDLNSASAEELQELGLLQPGQIQQLLDHRKRLGPLAAIYELQAVQGFDLPLIRKLLPYVMAGHGFAEQVPFRRIWTEGQHTLQLRYSRTWAGRGASFFPAPDKPPAYAGSLDKAVLRYRYAMGRHGGWGLVLEKDAGEAWLRKGTPLPDHIGFHWAVRRPGLLKCLVVGDYTINVGQGLMQWHGMAPGKSSSVMQFKREGEAARPYAGAGEFYFYRGLAGTLALRKSELTAWLSVRQLDGRLKLLDEESAAMGGTLLPAGYHRTASELEARGNVRQHTAGAIWKRRWAAGHVGVNVQGHRFAVPLQRGTALYQLFRFADDRLLEAGVDHAFTWRNVHFFGEVVRSSAGGWAFMQGGMAALSPAMDAGWVWRSGEPGFAGLYGAPFGVTGTAANERGCYGALQVKVKPNWLLSGYVDMFGFPWLRYRVGAPSVGSDVLLAVHWNPARHATVHGSYRFMERMQDKLREGHNVISPASYGRHQFQLRWELPLTPAVTWRVRAQSQVLESGPGWIAMQQWNWRQGRWKGSWSHAWYDGPPGEGMYLSGLGFPGDGTVNRFSGTGGYVRMQIQRSIAERWNAWFSWQYAGSRTVPQTIQEWRNGMLPEARSTIQLQLQYEWGE
ncbi:helix-hairpin-helix domain-containing protein [Chitinophaga pollutisoli]|uniref:Helix-hairpin-helix domain-containing protein n=1 Tax=Chitinophaga pollutisoli TaxID=3133966 RepID=A0ABZ2YUU6_9BACT